jgi:dihydrofolate reductase
MFKSSDPAGTAWTVDKISGAGLHIMGSRTFRDMVSWWPTSTEIFAAPMNEIPKAVFSRSGKLGESTQALQDATRLRGDAQKGNSAHAHTWAEAEIIGGDLKTGIERLKKQEGKSILAHGGASFAQSLIATRLIDEYQLLIFPTALGSGLPIFSKLDAPLALKLVEHKIFPSGVAAHVYRPAQ